MSRLHEDNERTTVLVIGGMHCAACVMRVENAIRSVSGVETAGVNLLTRLATVRHAAKVEPRTLAAAIADIGYQATLASPAAHSAANVSLGDSIDLIASRKSRFIAGACFTLLIILINRFWVTEDSHKLFLLFVLATPVQITVGWEYYRGFFRALRRFSFNMDSLVVLGSTAAYLQGFLCFLGQVTLDFNLANNPQFHVGATILTVMSLGKWLEARAHESTRQLWASLVDMAPSEACVLREGREQTIPAGVVAVGDIVVVRPQERIPVDGEIIDGTTEVNEGLITGEILPVPKVKGDRVIAATANLTSTIKIRAHGVGFDTTISQIAKMAAAAQRRKTPAANIADRISAYMVPVSIVVAACVFVTSYFGPLAAKSMVNSGLITASFFMSEHPWLSFLLADARMSAAIAPAVAVLIISCPCALGLAASTAVIIATGIGARLGILIKDDEALETAAGITDVVFDKKRALIDGSFTIQEILCESGVISDDLLMVAGSIEAHSQDALAKSVVKEVRKHGLELRNTENFEPLPGRGLRGNLGINSYVIGSRELVLEHGRKISERMEKEIAAAEASGATLLYVAMAENTGPILGAIAMANKIKESAPSAIADLRAMGLRVHLLSGDTFASVLAVGQQSGLNHDEVHGLMKPEDKVDYTQQLKSMGRRVAVVGDGISDAAALTAADLGLALGTGTGVAVESGQIVLVSTEVRGVPRSLRLARLATRIIRWNMFWAFSINLLMIPFALFTGTNPTVWSLIAIALVTLNSLRLQFSNINDPNPPVQTPETDDMRRTRLPGNERILAGSRSE